MISWLIIIILAYVFFSLSFFGDKLVLSVPQTGISTKADNPRVSANPMLYTFYIGMLNLVVIFLIPFAGAFSLTAPGIAWAFLASLASIIGLYSMFTALQKFEVSRVMSSMGAVQPIVTLVLVGIFWGFEAITRTNLLAFVLLLVGSVTISLEGKMKITWQYLALTMAAATMFSFVYIFSKMVFLEASFLRGMILIGGFNFLLSLCLLFDKNLRGHVFSRKAPMDKKTGLLFLFSQSAGGTANLLQSFAIFLAPVSGLAIINALRGVQYVFLFLLTLFFSRFFPNILKEDISAKMIVQKVASIGLIVLGLAILVLK